MQNDPKLRIEGSAVRNGDFKFIKNKETDALYNLKEEISEQTNLKFDKKNIYDSLRIEFKKWTSTLMEPIFLGLLANDEYNKLNPDQFQILISNLIIVLNMGNMHLIIFVNLIIIRF